MISLASFIHTQEKKKTKKTTRALDDAGAPGRSQPDVNDGALLERLAAANSINLDKSLLRQN